MGNKAGGERGERYRVRTNPADMTALVKTNHLYVSLPECISRMGSWVTEVGAVVAGSGVAGVGSGSELLWGSELDLVLRGEFPGSGAYQAILGI